jgi:hypothetical protein
MDQWGGFPAVLGIQLSLLIGRRSRRDRPTPLVPMARSGGATAGEPYRFTETPALPGRWIDGRVWA